MPAQAMIVLPPGRSTIIGNPGLNNVETMPAMLNL